LNLERKCPDCGATGDAVKVFESGCTLLDGAPPHYMCSNCRALWSREVLVQKALGTSRGKIKAMDKTNPIHAHMDRVTKEVREKLANNEDIDSNTYTG
jgi:hypothetical protein